MSLRDFLKRRREQAPKANDGDAAPKHRPELRDAWLAFETDYPDRALELAAPHVDSTDAEVAADAKKLVALIRFRRGEYGDSLPLFRDVVAVHDDAGNWFNVCTAATLGGDTEAGQLAFQKAITAQERGDGSDGLSIPFMRQYYACALRDRGEYDRALEQIEELRSIYEQLKITDDTFVYIRGVPFLSHTMDVAVDVFRGLGGSTGWHQWIDSFAEKVDAAVEFVLLVAEFHRVLPWVSGLEPEGLFTGSDLVKLGAERLAKFGLEQAAAARVIKDAKSFDDPSDGSKTRWR